MAIGQIIRRFAIADFAMTNTHYPCHDNFSGSSNRQESGLWLRELRFKSLTRSQKIIPCPTLPFTVKMSDVNKISQRLFFKKNLKSHFATSRFKTVSMLRIYFLKKIFFFFFVKMTYFVNMISQNDKPCRYDKTP